MSLYVLKDYPFSYKPSAVCLGMFDGVHRGHQALISHTCRAAEEKNLIPCAFTFDIPPACFLFPEKNIPILTDIEVKNRLLHHYGLENVIYAPFGHEIEHMSAKYFFDEILCKSLHASHVVIGFHYHFGFKAEGNPEMMQKMCAQKGITLDIVPPVTLDDGQLISSTAIRGYLLNGETEKAKAMLLRPLTEHEEQIAGGTINAK